MADISNSSKPWNMSYKWTDLLYQEFYKQGDKERERNMSISNFMDRYTTNISTSQIGFINNLVKPAFEILHKVNPLFDQILHNLDDNLEHWKIWEKQGSSYQDSGNIDSHTGELRHINS